MMTTQKDPIPVIPRIGQNTDAVVGTALSVGQRPQSKAARMAEVMKQDGIVSAIGSAWPLYFHLILVEGGKMVGSYDEIGLSMGTVGKTVRNWVKALEKAGIASSETKGHQVRIRLLGEHMDAASAQDEIIQVMASDATGVTGVAAMSPEMRNATRLLQAAEEAGAPIELRTVLSWKR